MYVSFLNHLNAANLDLQWMVSAGSLTKADFHDNFLLTTIGPLVILPVVGRLYKTMPCG